MVVWDTALTPTSLAAALGPAHVTVFVGPTLPVADFDAAFGLSRVVELAQRFTVLTNKDYPAATTFSSDPKGYLVGGRQGFGDFTILKPSTPQKGGGGAGAVAVHMTYQDPSTKELIVQHFLSTDTTVRTPKDGIKLLQALEKLHIQQTVTTPGRFLTTPGYLMLDDYRKRKHATTLAKSKHAQLSHHLSTVAAAL
ncbi:sce7725 family protein [Curtobacterium sp. MCBD17_035]|uniref:sce7725 family protein n=1 Tax=Curtobacterium sp. MCBD17_035 TaxID=2175673 RepID=UPI0015E8AFBC|nr:sce7725 family protein [Curtobacterium sp. MCBD17_035]WIB67572.1 sce7725 family protein [Curtobacterium sp. MCBD17_035]